VEGIVVVGTVERVIVRAVAIAIDIELAEPFFGAGDTGTLDGDAGDEGDELAEIAAVEWEFLDEPVLNISGELRFRCIDERRGGGDSEGGGSGAGSNDDVESGIRADFDDGPADRSLQVF